MTIETRVNSLWVYPSREGLSHVSATPPVPGNYWSLYFEAIGPFGLQEGPCPIAATRAGFIGEGIPAG